MWYRVHGTAQFMRCMHDLPHNDRNEAPWEERPYQLTYRIRRSAGMNLKLMMCARGHNR